MAIKVTMPKLGLTMTEGTITEWKKKEGEQVEEKEILYVLETEKVTYEVEAPASGTLGKIVAKEGDVVPVGGVVAYILQAGETLADITELAVEKAEAKVPVETKKAAVETPEVPREAKISPLARKLAEEHGIDMSTVKGSGPGGRIVKEDILRAVEESKAVAEAATKEEVTPVEEEIVPLTSMRQTIARRMAESFQSAPHFYLTIEVDARELDKVHQQLLPLVENKVGIRLTYTDLLTKIAAMALEENPEMNRAFADGGTKVFRRIDISLVTAVEGGLIAPVIRQANQKSVAEIAKDRAELTEKAKQHKLSPAEMTGSTFTIFNLEMLGIDQFSAIIQPPEGAILAIGRIVEKPMAIQEEIVIRPMISLTLSIDHRILDGVLGANFLQRVKELIENPGFML